jgi:adenosylcobinamide kinase/adenosylcobinamide-phosphate guanylyltransferase
LLTFIVDIMPERHLNLGAARSGKKSHALALARSMAAPRYRQVTYVATAQALDGEMEHRIAVHRAERPADWATVEAPLKLVEALVAIDSRSIVIVDCMTLWLSNLLITDFKEDAPTAPLPAWSEQRAELLRWLARFGGDILLVSNEVGAGIVPMSAMARRFQDEQGRLNQAVAAECDRVTLVVAGIPLGIKPQ